MKDYLNPGDGVLFMKVGTHAQEKLSSIFKRKVQEINNTGFTMWGYGGNTCHPRTMVQPFADKYEREDKIIHLVMEEVDSNHFAEQVRADKYSIDGIKWEDIPDSIDVLGSRFALLIDSLEKCDFHLSLDDTVVPIGPSSGRLGSNYLKGRVDKACLEISENSDITSTRGDRTTKDVKISLVAKLKNPYAVLLRNS